MLYSIIFIIGFVTILLFLVWWFLLRKKTEENPEPITPTRNLNRNLNRDIMGYKGARLFPGPIRQNTDSYPNKYETLRQRGYPIPTQNTNIDIYSDAKTVDQQVLLEMNKKKPPHPIPEFTSNLAKLGDPFRGDLIIAPRRGDVSIPYNASIEDIKTGYFS